MREARTVRIDQLGIPTLDLAMQLRELARPVVPYGTIPRGTRLRVTAVHTDAGGTHHVTASIVK